MTDLPLDPIRLPPGVERDPALPTLKRVRSGYIHPLRAHCFRRTASNFTAEQRAGVQNLPASALTYVYEMEEDERDTIKRHTASRAIQFDRPFAEGLLQKGIVCTPLALGHCANDL